MRSDLIRFIAAVDRDPVRWSLDSVTAERRRRTFWELNASDKWKVRKLALSRTLGTQTAIDSVWEQEGPHCLPLMPLIAIFRRIKRRLLTKMVVSTRAVSEIPLMSL